MALRRWRRVAAFLAIGLLVACAIWGVPYLRSGFQVVVHARAAAAREPVAVATWRGTYGDPDALVARYLHERNNATADQLVALARPLSVALEGPSRDFPELRDFGQYVFDATKPSETGEMSAAPSAVRSYLDAHRAAIESVVDLLAHADVPVWKATVSSPVPFVTEDVSPYGARILNLVLAADALVAAREGRMADADRIVRAACQFGRSVRDQPQLIGQLMSMAVSTDMAKVVRWIDLSPESWRRRFDEYDQIAGLNRAIEMEVVTNIRVRPAPTFFQRAFLADYVDGMRTNLEQMQTLSVSDAPVPVPPARSDGPVISPGSTVSEIALPGLERAWQTAACANLETELTDRVLDVRQVRLETGHWPARAADVPSTLVSGAHWIYALHPNDEISISLSRPLPACSETLAFDARR